MSFWGELKRRNVVKVGLAYAVVAWLLIQVSSVVVPTFEAPGWVMPTLTFLLILGFPIVLIVAWAFEITPEGIKKTAQVPLEDSITHLTGQKLNYVVTALLAVAVVFLVVDNYVLDESAEPRPNGEGAAATLPPTPVPPAVETQPALAVMPNSVAVLPFVNLSPKDERALIDEYLHGAGHDPATLRASADAATRILLIEASKYAAARLTEVESRAHYLRELRHQE